MGLHQCSLLCIYSSARTVAIVAFFFGNAILKNDFGIYGCQLLLVFMVAPRI